MLLIPREISLTERTAVLSGLRRVGPRKALGYLPLRTITDILQISPATLLAEAASKGLAAIQIEPDRCCIKSGALYVYDRKALGELLEGAASTLNRHGLPLDPDQFVQHIAANWFESDHPAYPVIEAAFGLGH